MTLGTNIFFFSLAETRELIGAIILGAIITASLHFFWLGPNEEQAIRISVIKEKQKEAILAGKAKWITGEDAEPKFAWTTCTALGTPRK